MPKNAKPETSPPGKETSPRERQSEDKAAAFKDARQPGPQGAPVQVRPAGAEATRDDKDWDERDEASDESFPASDASAKY